MLDCPRCGTRLDPDGPAGLCPKCLIQGAFDSGPGAEGFSGPAIEPGIATTSGDDDFGRYRIVRPLGEGGMGTVYLAEQREPIRRNVALKVIKLGMDTAQVLARFDNERQALAMMDHPNIARIFDAGATAKGRPYFVMEYIDGAPITEFCDRKRMAIQERLRLFLAVCRAVQHAHQKGVIHRDLKPSNVLVAEQDGAAVPKVIDFGIAKATDKWAVENSLLTQFGQIVGTPEYASPEQADTMTGEIDEPSDVYSLGVILYELLVGAVPFDTATLRNAGLAEMLRIIREDEAPALPRKLTSLGAGASSVAARRQTDPPSLRRRVDGDLNSITMKALEKNREQRYATVSDLAADIQRHLEDRPVLASPPSRLYRMRKFLRRRRAYALGAAAALLLLALSGGAAWSLRRRDANAKPKLTSKDTIILADFENKTGDPVFDDTLRQGLSVELRQSPFLTLISDRKIQQTLRLMGRPKETGLSPEIAQQICERVAGAAVLEGSITLIGSQYVLGLRARNCSTGAVLDEEQAVASKKEDVVNALSQIARTFRIRVGESLATVERHSVPLAEATTSSLEALRAYTSAVKISLSSGGSASIPFFRRAVEVDPKFALAHAYLGLEYSGNGESAKSVESTAKAWALRDRVSDRERFFIDFTYDRQVTGNLEKAYRTLELWLQTYPRGEEPGFALGPQNPQGLLGGISTHGTGRFERVIEASQKEIALDPDFAIAYTNLALGYFYTDRFSDVEGTLQRAATRKAELDILRVIRYNTAVLQGDQQEMDRAAALARSNRVDPHWMDHLESLALARSGRLQGARRLSNRAVELALHGQEPEAAATYAAVRAVWEAICGNASEGKASAMAALKLSKGRDVSYAAGLALALSGVSASQTEALVRDLEKRFPDDTFARFTYVPVLHGLVSLGRSELQDSVERLELARPYEVAVNGLNFAHFYMGGLHSAYVRGEALLALHRYSEAAGEFQRILDHRGLVGADPLGVLAHWRLGRAFALSGDRAKAKTAYQAFFSSWKDADPSVPVLRTARAEYQRL